MEQKKNTRAGITKNAEASVTVMVDTMSVENGSAVNVWVSNVSDYHQTGF